MLSASALRGDAATPDGRLLDVMNFAVVGEARSGSAVVSSGLNNTAHAVCHLNLLHEKESVRRACHEGYFGSAPADPTQLPEWYVDGATNPHQYLSHRVWDRPLRGELFVGLRLPYSRAATLELYDLLEDRCREGSFCVVHVQRNPLACLVSLAQARRARAWCRLPDSRPAAVPPPVALAPEKVTRFVRQSASVRAKIAACCDDAIVVRYADVLLDYDREMRRVLDFLGLDPRRVSRPDFVRMRNVPIQERVANFKALRDAVPDDVRAVVEDEEIV